MLNWLKPFFSFLGEIFSLINRQSIKQDGKNELTLENISIQNDRVNRANDAAIDPDKLQRAKDKYSTD